MLLLPCFWVVDFSDYFCGINDDSVYRKQYDEKAVMNGEIKQLERVFRKRQEENSEGNSDVNADVSREEYMKEMDTFLRIFIFHPNIAAASLQHLLGIVQKGVRTLPVRDMELADMSFEGGDMWRKIAEMKVPDSWWKVAAILYDMASALDSKEIRPGWRVTVAALKEEKKRSDLLALKKQAKFFSQFRFLWGWRIPILLGLLAGVYAKPLDLEQPFFILLKFGVSAASGWWAWEAHIKMQISWRNTYALLALLYNPFLPMELGSAAAWAIINFLTLVLIIVDAIRMGKDLR